MDAQGRWAFFISVLNACHVDSFFGCDDLKLVIIAFKETMSLLSGLGLHCASTQQLLLCMNIIAI
jgi:hypothetical protein